MVSESSSAWLGSYNEGELTLFPLDPVPGPPVLTSIALRLQLDILPVRMHVDQDAIDFCKRFVSFSDASDSSRDASSTDPSRPGQFIRKYACERLQVP